MTIKKGNITIASSTPTTEWGSIEGTLADQADLKALLDAKAPTLSPVLTGVPTAPTAQEGTNTNQIATTKFVKTEINTAIENIDALPSQTGQSGKFLTTDGTDASWGNIPSELPSQTGQAGKVLTTNGSTVSWTEYQSAPATDDETIHLNSSDELEVIGTIEKNAGNVKYDWIGTYAQWEAGRNNNSIPDSWICYITDDYVSSTVTHNIGDVFYSLRTEDIINGAVVCDGSEYNIDDYSSGNISLQSLLDSGKIPYVSISTFDSTVSTNGSCRCFGYDGGSTFKVPKLNDVFIEAGVAANNSEFIEAGLPNITGKISFAGLQMIRDDSDTGNAISRYTSEYSYGLSGGGSNTQFGFTIDASRSSSIYGNSNTVQPESVKYRAFIQLANATSESALQTVSSIVNDVEELQDAMEETVNYKNITNCITEIPQDIKVELVNYNFKISAGSKVYVPNGFEQDGTTPHFDEYIIPNDYITDSINANQTQFHLWNVTQGYFGRSSMDRITSSPTAPSNPSNYSFWYNTTDNIIKRYVDNAWTSDIYSLPICIATMDDTKYTSIDQVFNGFGYIGSTVFALPGVKGLIPNGRNEDGSLKNTLTEVTSVITKSYSGTEQKLYWGIVDNTIYYQTQSLVNYNENKNTTNWKTAIIAKGEVSNSTITQFIPKTSFHALDYNDKGTISGWSMPSNKYIDLTLGATGSTYTAPADGYFFVSKKATAANQWITIENTATKLSAGGNCAASGNYERFTIPVKSGDVIEVSYNTAGDTMWFRFIYAEGEI